MPETPPPPPGRPLGEFKARLNREIAFTIIDEQIHAGTDQAQLTGRGLAKQYGFGSPQTWVTHLKDWRQQHGFSSAPEEGVREAETAEPEPVGTPAEEPTGSRYGVISRSEFLQHQEMWNRLLAEREQAHVERVRVARLEGENVGRAAGRDEGMALAAAREHTLEERARRERLEGEREGAQRALTEWSQRQRGERRLMVSLAFLVGLPLGAVICGVILWPRATNPPVGIAGAAQPAMTPTSAVPSTSTPTAPTPAVSPTVPPAASTPTPLHVPTEHPAPMPAPDASSPPLAVPPEGGAPLAVPPQERQPASGKP